MKSHDSPVPRNFSDCLGEQESRAPNTACSVSCGVVHNSTLRSTPGATLVVLLLHLNDEEHGAVYVLSPPVEGVEAVAVLLGAEEAVPLVTL